MIRFTIYTYLFKPINEPQEPDMFSPEVNVEESMARKLEIFGDFFRADYSLKFHRGNQRFDHLIVGKLYAASTMGWFQNTSSWTSWARRQYDNDWTTM